MTHSELPCNVTPAQKDPESAFAAGQQCLRHALIDAVVSLEWCVKALDELCASGPYQVPFTLGAIDPRCVGRAAISKGRTALAYEVRDDPRKESA